MFGWLKRLLGIAKAEANSAMDKMEDPVKMTEQGIRDLKNDLNKSLQSLAEVKAMHIRSKKELEAARRSEGEYEQKAILLLQKAEKGEMSAEEADRLASMALDKKESIAKRAVAIQKNISQYDPMVKKMEQNVQHLKNQITSWENELKTLKARSKVSEATKKLNKQIAQVDSSDTISRLERMREKVTEQETLAESYGEIADMNTGVDDEIDKALGGDAAQSISSQSESLKKLKAKMAEQKGAENAGQGADSSDKSQKSSAGSDDADQGEGASGKATNPNLDELKQKLRNAQGGTSDS